MHVLAIDPGKDKCGLAVVTATGEVLMRRIIASGEIQSTLPALIEEHRITQLVLGNSTTSQRLFRSVNEWLPQLSVALVDETGSTLEARSLYWRVYPPRGWRALLPLSLQTPPVPIDDFAAVVLARRYFGKGS